jgi:hypothetical protein
MQAVAVLLCMATACELCFLFQFTVNNKFKVLAFKGDEL